MPSTKIFDYIIIGAGPSGLVCAYELQKRGFSTLIIDRDSQIGGLSKSITYNHESNHHIFDTGPKRFHSDDSVVLDFLHEICQFEIIGRSTEVYFGNRYFEWPLQTSQILKLPPVMAAKCAIDLIKKAVISEKRNVSSSTKNNASFKNYILSQYGSTLFNTFFQPYTEKFLRWNIDDIHADWASTGINRTVIDDRVDATSIFALLRAILLPQKNETTFLYPKEGGFGNFFQVLSTKLSNNPNIISEQVLNSFPTSIVKGKGDSLSIGLNSTETSYVAERGLVWTGNLNDLAGLIGSASNLNYLNTVFYDVIVKSEEVKRKKAQWTYISNRNSLISRVTSMKEFSPSTCPEGYYNLVAEVTDSQLTPKYFDAHLQLKTSVREELIDIGILTRGAKIEAINSRPIRDTYPIYKLDYKKSFNDAHREIKKFSKNIHLLGRSGAFWYNNSDHSIRMALETVKRLVGETDVDFDYRGYFGGKPEH